VVVRENEGVVAVIKIDNPPVNALGSAVAGLKPIVGRISNFGQEFGER
jgi:hypothetical protein